MSSTDSSSGETDSGSTPGAEFGDVGRRAEFDVSAEVAEAHSFVAFPRRVAIPLGEWILRWEPWQQGRVRKRANSALAIGDPGRPIDVAVDTICRFYRNRDRRIIVQVVAGSPIHNEFVARQWVPVAGSDADYLLTGVAAALDRCEQILAEAEAAAPRSPVVVAESDRHVEVAGPDSRGEAALDDGWLYIHGLYVAPDRRRRGLAHRVMREILRWGIAHDAQVVWLHVETDNSPALRLYERLGFRLHHSLRYLTPSDPSPEM